MTDNKQVDSLYGLIGYPLSHSFSQKFFTEKFERENITNSAYVNFEINDINLFPEIISANLNLKGINVTIPYKESIIPFLDEIDEGTQEIGAVNTIKVNRTGNTKKLIGYNTDVFGFRKSIEPMLTTEHKKALILGTGGASKAIKYVLQKLSIEYISASIEELKENEISYQHINNTLIKEHLIIINATPLGTYPRVDTCPDIPYEALTNKHVLFDLVYNPKVTLFLQKGKEAGANCKNGLEMLHGQAIKSYEIWNQNNL